MRKAKMLAGTLCAAMTSVCAVSAPADSVKIVTLQEVQVVSTRANVKTPVAFTNISKEQLKNRNTGQDLPYLLSLTPSLITTSDAGAGVGYTTMRVRGTDATRINVTANGIPMNDAESHSVFFVNLPDFASSVKDVQVQRGAGTSTNGAGAFGASVNMQTESISMKPFVELNGSYGSFNTHKETVKLGTGLINNHWAVDARLSNIGTDGYIDRASVNLNSYFIQAGYFGERTLLKFITFNGTEETYHAWYYASREDMQKYGRRYNSCGEYTDDNKQKRYYDNQTDNYHQQNYQLHLTQVLHPDWKLNVALHYTRGDGYYEEYKTKRTLEEYGLKPYEQGTTITQSDLIRRKQMGNDFGGGIFSVDYTKNRLALSIGGGVNHYAGDHFGRVIWVKNYVGSLSPNHEYYRNSSKKTDANLYARANYDLGAGWSLYADVQGRNIHYTIDGANENFDYNVGKMQSLTVHKDYTFLNPKAGINWQLNKQNRFYASFAVAQKEPTRNNFTDAGATDPRSERLDDYELGYSYTNPWLTAGVNLYYMNYKDQLVLTGQLNHIGEPMTENVDRSYRTGVELSAAIRFSRHFSWQANATFSRNRIKNFNESLYEDEWTNPITVAHGSTPIAFSPDCTVGNLFTYNYRGFEAGLQSQYVSKQYMSNARQEEHLLDAYFVSNLHLAYSFNLKGTKGITLGCTVYNLFNEEYENNGYAGSGYSVNKQGEKVRYNYAGYAAQAGTNVMANISLKF